MHLDLEILFKLGDRFGVPILIFGVLAWLAYLFIRGPAMALAGKLGDGFGALCRAGVDYLGEATVALRALPSHVTVEAMATRETVKAEGSATREHVTEAVEKIRDRVSAAENELQRSVTATGQHAVTTSTPATGLPVTTKASQ